MAFAALVLASIQASAGAASAEPICAARPRLAGPCFAVAGRLRLHDGTPSARIAVTGTRRILGVEPWFEPGNESFSAPEAVRRAARFDRALVGRWLVCPLDRAVPGRMRLVCIERALSR